MLNRLFGLRCPDCGNPISEEDNLCPHCGANLDTPVKFTTSSENPNTGTEVSLNAADLMELAQQAYDCDNNLKEALEHCNLAIQMSPGLAEAHNLHGLILDALGQMNEAIDSYREALRLDPNLEDAKTNLDDAEAERSRTEEKISRRQKIALRVGLGVAGITVLACMVAAFGLLYKFADLYIKPPRQVILEPDYSQVTSIDQTELENTAQMLTERSQALGYKNITFRVSENNQIIGRIPDAIDSQVVLKRITAIGLLEFVDFGNKSFPSGTSVATDYEYKYLSQPDGTKWHTIMTNAEVTVASTEKNRSGQYEIPFALSPTGTKIFADYTTQNINKVLGIVLDKHIISAPIVNSPIINGSTMITGNFSKEEADNLAAYLNTKGPLPIPLKIVQISGG